MPNWKDILAQATTERTLNRAQVCLGRKTIYQAGAGGAQPDAVTQPLAQQCDCSGFVDWAIGTPRELPPGSDKWLYTDSIWEGGGDVGQDLFRRITTGGQPGDFFVYPSPAPHELGHIGIITEVDATGKPTRMIHCSHGNYINTGDAIRITPPDVISQNKKSRIMRLDYDKLKTVAGVLPV